MSTSRNAWIRGATRLGVLLCVAGCATPGSKPQLSVDAQAEALSHFSLGLLAENSGDSEAALRHLKEAIRIDPGEKTIYPPAIAAALQLNRPEEALQIIEQLRKRQPDALAPRLLHAQVCVLTDRTSEAEALFQEAVLAFPDDPKSHLSLARFFISQERNPEAIRTLQSAEVLHGENAEIAHMLGTLYVDRARDMQPGIEARDAILEGIVLLEKSLAIAPDNPQRWQQLGYACLAVRNLEKARTAFEKTYQLYPQDIQIARQLLDICIQDQSIDRALTLCEEIPRHTETDPELWIQYLSERLPEELNGTLAEHLQAYLNDNAKAPVFYYAQLGSLYLDEEKLDDAERVLTDALAIYPNNERLRIVIGYLSLQKEHYQEAYDTFHQVQSDFPGAEWAANPFFTFNLMVAAQKSGHLEEAAEVLASSYTEDPVILTQYMQALLTGNTPLSARSAIDLLNQFRALTPEAAEALYYLTILQADQEEYEEALLNARQFETLSGGDTNRLNGFFYYQYAVIQERTGNLDEAEDLFRKAIDRGNPTTAAASQNYMAYMWAERGEKLEMGLALIQKALKAEPDNAAFIDTLGWIYYMQEHYQDALDQLEKACGLIPDDPAIWEHLGDVYLKLGRPQAAVQQWEKALELAPDEERLIQRIKENRINSDELPAQSDSPEDTPLHP